MDKLSVAIENLEELATDLADANKVEQAWALRGVIDGLRQTLAGQEPVPETGTYRRDYNRGLAAIVGTLG